MAAYGVFALWIGALVWLFCMFPAPCLFGFGGLLTVTLIRDAVETRRFGPW